MQNRRDFFKAVAGAAAGAYAVGRGMPALAQRGGGGQRGGAAAPTGPVKRREVFIGRKRVRVIDLHAHCTVEACLGGRQGDAVRAAGGWPGARPGAHQSDRQRRDRHPGAHHQRYWWWKVQDRDHRGRIVRAQNEGPPSGSRRTPIASSRSRRCRCSFPSLAAEQLDYGVKALGLRGARSAAT
jgi:hypothetical protein